MSTLSSLYFHFMQTAQRRNKNGEVNVKMINFYDIYVP
jgi:hypothetical protein